MFHHTPSLSLQMKIGTNRRGLGIASNGESRDLGGLLTLDNIISTWNTERINPWSDNKSRTLFDASLTTLLVNITFDHRA